MDVRKGICVNFDVCSIADKNRGVKKPVPVEISILDDPDCPECGSPLQIIEDKKSSLPVGLLAGVAAAVVALGAGAFFLFSGGGGAKATATLNPPSVTVMVDNTERLTIATDPEDAAQKLTWTWTSDDESVATVSRSGVVTGVAPGNATITATAKKVSASAQVTVEPNNPVVSVTLSQNALSLRVNGTTSLAATVAPDNAANPTLAWSSTDETVATVSDGTVTALKAGTAVIKATSTDGSNISAECNVTVTETAAPAPATGGGGSSRTYSFGRYEGAIVNGRPQGTGTMTYTCRVQIAKQAQPRHTYTAERGDSFTGTWHNGDIEHGVLTRSNGEQITITAGRRPSPYDLTNDRCE